MRLCWVARCGAATNEGFQEIVGFFQNNVDLPEPPAKEEQPRQADAADQQVKENVLSIFRKANPFTGNR